MLSGSQFHIPEMKVYSLQSHSLPLSLFLSRSCSHSLTHSLAESLAWLSDTSLISLDCLFCFCHLKCCADLRLLSLELSRIQLHLWSQSFINMQGTSDRNDNSLSCSKWQKWHATGAMLNKTHLTSSLTVPFHLSYPISSQNRPANQQETTKCHLQEQPKNGDRVAFILARFTSRLKTWGKNTQFGVPLSAKCGMMIVKKVYLQWCVRSFTPGPFPNLRHHEHGARNESDQRDRQ